MTAAISDQTQTFLFSCLLGVSFGLLYDLFRITRLAFKLPRWIILLEDLIFFGLCAVFTFLFLLETGDGRLRWYVLAGELLGAILYWATVGALVMRAATRLIKIITGILRRALTAILRPLCRLGRFFGRCFTRCRSRVRVKTVKMRNCLKINLKSPFRLLYNKLNHTHVGKEL